MNDLITLEVFRYKPDENTEPFFQNYEIPLKKEWVILDALNYVKDHLEGTLSYRWSCRMGVCGSCGMMVNGKPVLTCNTFVEKFSPGPIRIEPLENFPVIRDLVIEMSDFLDKLKSVKPWIIRDDLDLVEEEYRQTPDQLSDYKQYSMCINCMLCYSACPVYGLEPEFVGPAAIALAQRYNMDNRDQGNKERMEALSDDTGMWHCTFVGDCSAVCPENVDPAGAIQRYKVEGASHWWKNILMPWGKDN
ncbi:MAG: succinate dehydrogenase/fumarate reductase iron-sulfur subunit [Bacteroidetes bacterium]|nr:succinate dehydrogenase/fumarate reductase iron-sulfur subunit [Bacteroidota bacterium]